MLNNCIGVVNAGSHCYPKWEDNCFRPSENYPEYIWGYTEVSKTENRVYDAVRNMLCLLKLDEEHYGTKDWNPLGEFIKPGDTVLIKPNMVMDKNLIEENGTDCLYTQPSVVAPVIDYVLLALKGSGKLIIGDAPMQECKFGNLISTSGYEKMVAWYCNRGFDIELVDFRELSSDIVNGLYVQRINDNVHGKIVDLKNESEFAQLSQKQCERMRITNYNPDIMKSHHLEGKHEYFISDYALNADVIINMPKPKTHRKAGITAALKNMVGINVRKEFLPHHTMGAVCEGGDEYLKKSFIHKCRSQLLDRLNRASANNCILAARLYRFVVRACSVLMRFQNQQYAEGSWYGNQTVCKTIVDLNKVLLYADKDGVIKDTPQRKMFIIADMIVSGEKEGPVAPTPKNVGLIAGGTNPVCFDACIAKIMGADIERIPTLKFAKNVSGKHKLVTGYEQVRMVSNDLRWNNKGLNDISKDAKLNFIPTSGWKPVFDGADGDYK